MTKVTVRCCRTDMAFAASMAGWRIPSIAESTVSPAPETWASPVASKLLPAITPLTTFT